MTQCPSVLDVDVGHNFNLDEFKLLFHLLQESWTTFQMRMSKEWNYKRFLQNMHLKKKSWVFPFSRLSFSFWKEITVPFKHQCGKNSKFIMLNPNRS